MTATDTPDPQPGDFDAELEAIDPRDALERIAHERGEEPSEGVASLIRGAAGRAA